MYCFSRHRCDRSASSALFTNIQTYLLTYNVHTPVAKIGTNMYFGQSFQTSFLLYCTHSMEQTDHEISTHLTAMGVREITTNILLQCIDC